MTCQRLHEQFDDFIDGTLDATVSESLQQHVAGCDACKQLVDREQGMRRMLQEYGNMATPDAGFFDATLAQAARDGRRQQQKRSWLKGFGSAVAAGMAVWIVSSVWFAAPGVAPDAGIPVVSMAVEQPRTVNLVFSSASALDDATLTVSLPDGVEIAGFEGQREITWLTSLREGKNLLPLKLVGTLPTEGVLLATLKHGDDDRTFRLRIDVG